MRLQQLWQAYQTMVRHLFGQRIVFLGLQGSYARGEAAANSDLDVVLILDQVNLTDLQLYQKAIAALPDGALVCGFFGGKEELAHWSRADLFQFYYDTMPYQGNLAEIFPVPTREDAGQAVHLSACNLYHLVSHQFVHQTDLAGLQAAYKMVRFALQAKHFAETGDYLQTQKELEEALTGLDQEIWQLAQHCRQQEILPAERLRYTEPLLRWASGCIVAFAPKSN